MILTCNMGWCGERCGKWKVQKSKVLWQKVFVGRPSQCIYRMIQDFLTHGIAPWFFIVYGIYPWFLTHSHFRIFFPFWENGAYVSINDQLLYIYKGRNNDVLSQFWWNLIVKFKMEEIMVGL